jgi:hypothetical protein
MSTTDLEKRSESRLRRLADKAGLRALKSRVREHFHSNNEGGWMLVDNYFNTVKAGVNFDLSTEEAIAYCQE